MKKKKKTRKTKRTLVVLTSLLVFIVIIIVGVYQTQLAPPPPKVPADEYFVVLNFALEDYELSKDGEYVKVYLVSFNLKPVGGDAHDVIIKSLAGTQQPEEFPSIGKGVSQFVELEFPSPYPKIVRKNAGRFPFSIEIYSRETGDGTITVYLDDQLI